MARSYKAVLRGDRVEWIDPPPVRPAAIMVQISLLEGAPPDPDPDRGRKMAKVLDDLARIGAFADVENPVRWQREVRRDRALPGRKA